ncbi:Protein GET1 [Pseudozyma hubeiensis]|nr:Protein GET1 [Pseudozyma hubeiensis]
MHPAIVIFLSVVVVQTIAAIGKQRLQDILWLLYTALFHRSTLSTQRRLRREMLTTKQQLSATSSQDQFAKWAKLRRSVDKQLATLEATNATLTSSRSTFNMIISGMLFVVTSIFPFAVTSWYSKTPIFWLPPAEHSWFGPVGWFLALPRAPKGAISSTVWQMVCSRTLIAVVGAGANFIPGKKETVVPPVGEAKIEELNEEKTGQSSKSGSTPTEASTGGQARKRTNAKPTTVSEKQDL